METQPLGVPGPTPAEAHCPSHPERRVLGTCARCGTFFCELDHERLNGKDYCDTCAALPEVDYLETFRLKYWGRRDGWAWLIGVGGLTNLVYGTVFLMREGPAAWAISLVALANAAVCLCFWLGLPFARLTLCILTGLYTLLAFSAAGPQAVSTILPLAITIAIYRDTRNKLFFKREVSREELQKTWHLYANNTVARWGLLLGIFGLIAVPLAPVALVCSIVGLRRVNPTANPPVGRKGQAIAGLVLGTVSLVGWLGWFAFVLAYRFFSSPGG